MGSKSVRWEFGFCWVLSLGHRRLFWFTHVSSWRILSFLQQVHFHFLSTLLGSYFKQQLFTRQFNYWIVSTPVGIPGSNCPHQPMLVIKMRNGSGVVTWLVVCHGIITPITGLCGSDFRSPLEWYNSPILLSPLSQTMFHIVLVVVVFRDADPNFRK